MTREEIFKLAQESYERGQADLMKSCEEAAIKAIEAAVAAEREKVAAWMIQRSYATGHGDTTEDLLKELDWQIDKRIAAERTRFADECIDLVAFHGGPVDLEADIRAKGQA